MTAPSGSNRLLRVGAVGAALSLALMGCASEDGGDSATADGASPASSDSCTIAIDNGSGTGFPFPNAGAQGVLDEAEELGCEVVANLDGKNEVQTEAANVQNIISLKPDGVVMIPSNAAEAAKFVDQLSEAGIKVVSFHSIIGADRPIDEVYPELDALVIEDESGAGKAIGEAMLEALPDGGKAAIILGAPGYAENTLRVEEFKEVVAGTFEIVAEQPGGWVANEGQAACASILNGNPDVDAFYAISDDMGVGCAKAVESAQSDALVFGVGGSKLGIEAVKSGELAGTICYKPYDGGRQATQALHKAITEGDYGKANLEFYETPTITQDNVDACDPQW